MPLDVLKILKEKTVIKIGDYHALVDVELERKIVFIRVLDNKSRICKRL